VRARETEGERERERERRKKKKKKKAPDSLIPAIMSRPTQGPPYNNVL
jgi:hypothetical protein